MCLLLNCYVNYVNMCNKKPVTNVYLIFHLIKGTLLGGKCDVTGSQISQANYQHLKQFFKQVANLKMGLKLVTNTSHTIQRESGYRGGRSLEIVWMPDTQNRDLSGYWTPLCLDFECPCCLEARLVLLYFYYINNEQLIVFPHSNSFLVFTCWWFEFWCCLSADFLPGSVLGWCSGYWTHFIQCLGPHCGSLGYLIIGDHKGYINTLIFDNRSWKFPPQNFREHKTSNVAITRNGCITLNPFTRYFNTFLLTLRINIKTSNDTIARNGWIIFNFHTGYINKLILTLRTNTKTSNDPIARNGKCTVMGAICTFITNMGNSVHFVQIKYWTLKAGRGCLAFGPGYLAFTETPPQFNFFLVTPIRWRSEYQGCLRSRLWNVWHPDGNNHMNILRAHYTFKTHGKLLLFRISTKTSNDTIAGNGRCDFGGVKGILVKIIHSHGTYTIAQNKLKHTTSTEVIARNSWMTPSSQTGYFYLSTLAPRLNTKTSNDTIARIGNYAGVGMMQTIVKILNYLGSQKLTKTNLNT